MAAPSPTYLLKMDPGSFDQFDASVTSLLIGLGGEKYVEIFRDRNISQETLMELTDDDLEKLGVDDPHVRAGITREIKNFPIYEQIQFSLITLIIIFALLLISLQTPTCSSSFKNPFLRKKLVADLDLEEIATMLRDSNQHLHRIYLSMIAVSLSLRKVNMRDAMIADKTVTSVIKSTLDEVIVTLNKMDYSLQSKFKSLSKNYNRRKKIVVGTIGSAAIVVLAVLFVQSLKQAK